MIPGLLIQGALELGKELVEDKDKKSDLAYKTMEKMLESKTYMWVDALVKLSYAAEQITKGLIRPIGSFVLAGFAMYCQVNGIELDSTVQMMLFGAPVGWGVSRHIEKGKKKPSKKRAKTEELDSDDFYE